VVIVVPVLLSLPAMVMPIPPLMVRIPAPLPLGIQIAATVVSFMAVFSMVVNSFIQPGFRFLDCMLALRAFVIGVHQWYCEKPRERCRQHGRYGCFSKSSNQSLPPLYGAVAPSFRISTQLPQIVSGSTGHFDTVIPLDALNSQEINHPCCETPLFLPSFHF